jgi:glycosyltransferase involved in cell wall biosynthesis
MPELITSGQTGLHFRAGEADDLRSQVNWMLSHPAELHQMRQAARAEFEARYTAERNYQRAIEIYETVIASARVK